MTTKPIQILLITDIPGNALFIKQALQDQRYHLNAVADGQEAVAYLRRQDSWAKTPRPDLILLDLQRPRTDGRPILIALQADVTLKSVPVIILTSAETEDDSFRSYAGRANAYLPKPLSPADFTRLMNGALKFWLPTIV